MNNKIWETLREFETFDLVKNYYSKLHNGKTINTNLTQEINACFIQGREYFKNAEHADISVKPLLLYYGISAITKGMLLITSIPTKSNISEGHGLTKNNWNGDINNIQDLKVKITNGLFYELLKISNNGTYYRHGSSGVNWFCNFNIPDLDSEIKFIELLELIPDLKIQVEKLNNKKIIHGELNDLKIEGNNKIFTVSKITSNEVESLFGDKTIYRQEKGKFVITTEAIPQISQGYYGDLGNHFGIGTLYVSKSLPGDIKLSYIGQLYMLSYYLGMLSRYYPKNWMNLSRSTKGDGIYPLLIICISYLEENYPSVILDHLSQIDSKNTII